MSEVGLTGETGASAPGSTRTVPVWDPLVRLIHWSVATGVLLNAVVLDAEGDTHKTVGFVLAGLVATRLIWGLVGSRHARFSAFPPNPVAALSHLRALRAGGRTVHLSHNPAGALMVYNLWATLIGMGITGYMMGTLTYFGVTWVEELHEGLFAWLVASIVLHLGGVFYDTIRTGVPLIRAMLDGRKRIPAGREIE